MFARTYKEQFNQIKYQQASQQKLVRVKPLMRHPGGIRMGFLWGVTFSFVIIKWYRYSGSHSVAYGRLRKGFEALEHDHTIQAWEDTSVLGLQADPTYTKS